MSDEADAVPDAPAGSDLSALVANLASTEAPVKTYAAEFAGYCRPADAHDALVKLLDDPTLDVRVRAAQSLVVLALPADALGLPAAAARPDACGRQSASGVERGAPALRVMAGLDPAIHPRPRVCRGIPTRSFRGGWPGRARP